MKVNLIKENDVVKRKLGFSWTIFFFGPFFPLLFRKKYKEAVLFFVGMFLIVSIVGVDSLASDIVLLSTAAFMSIYYNNYEIKEFIKNGYIPITELDEAIIKLQGIEY